MLIAPLGRHAVHSPRENGQDMRPAGRELQTREARDFNPDATLPGSFRDSLLWRNRPGG